MIRQLQLQKLQLQLKLQLRKLQLQLELQLRKLQLQLELQLRKLQLQLQLQLLQIIKTITTIKPTMITTTKQTIQIQLHADHR